MSIVAGFVASTATYVIMKIIQTFHVEPAYAEFGRMSTLIRKFGRMSTLIRKFGWNFGKTSYGCTRVWKDEELTVYTFLGLWMYKLLMKCYLRKK
ncbi:hypothetical protein VPH5P1B_0033 [Vibrio phage 5P1b]